MLAQPLAHVAIAAHVMHVVIGLEEFMLLDDPGHLFAHVGANDGRGELRVIVGGQQVADVVDQGADDQIVIGTVAPRAGGGLQRVPQPGDRIAFDGMVQIAQCAQHNAPAAVLANSRSDWSRSR